MTEPSGQYPDPEAIRQKRITELRREIAERTQRSLNHPLGEESHGGWVENEMALENAHAELSRLRNEQPKGGDRTLCPDCGAGYEETPILSTPKNPCLTCGAPLASPSPSPEPQDVREALQRFARHYQPWMAEAHPEHDTVSHIHITTGDICAAHAALAQSDAQPVGDIQDIAQKIVWRLKDGLAKFHGNDAEAVKEIAYLLRSSK